MQKIENPGQMEENKISIIKSLSQMPVIKGPTYVPDNKGQTYVQENKGPSHVREIPKREGIHEIRRNEGTHEIHKPKAIQELPKPEDIDDIEYSNKYNDDIYEYRHVILPWSIANKLPYPRRLLTETEWRALGVTQSLGWIHYSTHPPEPHILLFRRPLTSSILLPTIPIPIRPLTIPVVVNKSQRPITILPPFNINSL